MILKEGRMCRTEGCNLPCSYGERGGSKGGAVACSHHRQPSHVVMIPYGRCREIDCPKEARYGAPGGPRERCSDHKLEGMVTKRRNRVCEEEEGVCSKLARYGWNEGGKVVRSRCYQHKKEGMVAAEPKNNKKKTTGHPICDYKEEGEEGKACDGRAMFGFLEEGTNDQVLRTRCGKHKEVSDMLVGAVIVGFLLLILAVCGTIQKGMFTVRSAKNAAMKGQQQCRDPTCSKKATWGLAGEDGVVNKTHCMTHKVMMVVLVVGIDRWELAGFMLIVIVIVQKNSQESHFDCRVCVYAHRRREW